MKAVVVSFDRLHLGFLGCYGNPWIETPHWNQLAGESAVFDQHFGENFDPHARNHAWWTGCHQFPHQPDEQSEAHGSLIEKLRLSDVSTRLVISADSDIPAADRHFDDILATPARQPSTDETGAESVATWTGAALKVLSKLQPASDSAELVWLHCPGVTLPRPFGDSAASCSDVGSAVVLTGTDQPDSRSSPSAFDLRGDAGMQPDWTNIRTRYAEAVSCWDGILGTLYDACRVLTARGDCLLIVTAAAGEDWNGVLSPENGRLPLTEELIHTPFCIRLPDAEQTNGRYRQLVQTIDLAPTLLDWFHVSLPTEWAGGVSLLPVIRGQRDRLRDSVMLGQSQDAWGIRTEDFNYVRQLHEGANLAAAEGQLFLKPEDRWDVNDVAGRFPDVVADLERSLREFVDQQRLRVRSSLAQAR